MQKNTKIYVGAGLIAVGALFYISVWSKYNKNLTLFFGQNDSTTLSLPADFDPIVNKRQEYQDRRFSTIANNRAAVKNEMDFWGHQLAEHALFLHLGLEDKILKPQALKIHKKIDDFRKKLTVNNLEEMLPLVQELREFTVDTLTQLNEGKWMGWIFPSLARHYIIELDYFMDKVNGIPYTDQDEVTFWNTINEDHAGTTAHLLDPSEEMLVKQAEAFADKFKNLPKTEKEFLLRLSLTAAQELDKYNQTSKAAAQQNQVKSIIHPVLLDHIIREGQRSIQILNSLNNTQGAIYPS